MKLLRAFLVVVVSVGLLFVTATAASADAEEAIGEVVEWASGWIW